MPIRSSHALLATGAVLACFVQPVSAKTLLVGTCENNNGRQFSSIQSAVTAANPNGGDKVEICPGSYPEQVTISKPVTLENVPGFTSPTITLPTGTLATQTTLYGQAAVVQVYVASVGGSGVKIENVVVDGSGFTAPDGCADEFLGIYYQNAGGTISGTTAQNQVLPQADFGCQDGEAIFVENQVTGTPALKITGNVVTNFDKNGITVSYGAANATIENNTVTGVGPTDLIAQNGIQLGYGATGSIKENKVSDLIYTGGVYASSGILLYDIQAGSVALPSVSDNTVTDAQLGIALDAVNGNSSSSMVQVKSNTIKNPTSTLVDGIALYSDGPPDFTSYLNDDYINVQSNIISGPTGSGYSNSDDIDVCSNNNQIKANTVDNSAESGIHLDNSCMETQTETSGTGNSVKSNQINDNCVGILSGADEDANTIYANNSFSGNGTAEIFDENSASCGAHHAGKNRSMVRMMPQPRI